MYSRFHLIRWHCERYEAALIEDLPGSSPSTVQDRSESYCVCSSEVLLWIGLKTTPCSFGSAKRDMPERGTLLCSSSSRGWTRKYCLRVFAPPLRMLGDTNSLATSCARVC